MLRYAAAAVSLTLSLTVLAVTGWAWWTLI